MKTPPAVLGLLLLLGFLAGCTSLEEGPAAAALLEGDDVHAHMAIGGVT